MNLFTRTMTWLMLAFWLSATSVCTAECAKFAEHDLCCPESADQSSNQPANPDSNCMFSVALTKIHDEERIAWDFSLLPAVAPVLFLMPSDNAPPWQEAFPDLTQTFAHEWQFITRTALPPRAPSSLS